MFVDTSGVGSASACSRLFCDKGARCDLFLQRSVVRHVCRLSCGGERSWVGRSDSALVGSAICVSAVVWVSSSRFSFGRSILFAVCDSLGGAVWFRHSSRSGCIVVVSESIRCCSASGLNGLEFMSNMRLSGGQSMGVAVCFDFSTPQAHKDRA